MAREREARSRNGERRGEASTRTRGEYEGIDLNRASEEELAELPMVGPRRARYIVENRPFRSWEDVKRVPGLSEGMVDDLRHGGATIDGQNGGERDETYRHSRGSGYRNDRRSEGGGRGEQDDGGTGGRSSERRGQERSRGSERRGGERSRGGGGGYDEPIDLNEATREELLELEGIGARMADRIIQWREENGPFESVEDLLDIPGMNERTFEAIRDQVTVGRGKERGRRESGRDREGGRRESARDQESEGGGRRRRSEGGGGRRRGEIDLNSASVEDLTEIEGISRSRAEAIVEDRERNGPFRDFEDVREVPGISDRMVEKLEEEATVGGGSRQQRRRRQEA
jgi:competence protein ComEA